MVNVTGENPIRCFGDGDPLYENYHDSEWGVPVHDESALLERIVLEGFQSGLSWLTVLRKREAFREAFAGFDPVAVAAFEEDDIARLLGNPGIIRHRGKIRAAIANARALVRLHEDGDTLDRVIWSHAPAKHVRPRSYENLPASTPESAALSKALKKLGFTFIGPVTAYSTMQAAGVVNDHLASCSTNAVSSGAAAKTPTTATQAN
jgi:DNA-3-methyladenine glycosylase I